MIDPNSLSGSDRGAWVIYRGKERGRIKSWNNKFIFVVYACAGNWDEFERYTAASTEPCDLEWYGLGHRHRS